MGVPQMRSAWKYFNVALLQMPFWEHPRDSAPH
jgi:hypothetical protein